jgi:hypothetical protein
VLSIERFIAWPAQPNIDGYQFWAGVCVLPLLALRCTRIATHLEKKAIHIDGKRLKKLAKFVEFPGFVSRTDNKPYMDYLRIPHANRAQSLLPQLFLIRLYFTRSYKRNLHLIILEFIFICPVSKKIPNYFILLCTRSLSLVISRN